MSQHNYRDIARVQGIALAITSTGSSVQTTDDLQTTFNTDTVHAPALLLVADGTGYFKFGSNPTASASNSTLLPDGAGMTWIGKPGDKIAWISKTGTTSLNITELK